MLVPEGSGKPEGCVVAFTYPNSTGWVGFFILNASVRGKGLGRELWKELEAAWRASNTTVIGLDGVQEQVGTYNRRGYEDCARIHLMTRPSLKQKPFGPTALLADEKGEKLLSIKEANPQVLAKLDLEHTGLDRSAYWAQEALLSRKDAYGYALQHTSADKSNVAGYILVRRCEHGHRFGPLYAETFTQAQLLLHTAMKDISESDGSMIAEIFGSNQEGRKVFEQLGWEYTGIDYHRMWLGGRVPKEQLEGGKGTKGMFAIFDACAG